MSCGDNTLVARDVTYSSARARRPPGPTRGAVTSTRTLAPKLEVSHDPLERGDAPDGEGRRPGHLLPGGRAEGCTGGAPAARVPDQLADVPQPDPGPGGRVPRGRPGLPLLRAERDAAA